jgi:rhamnogalacturonyl hydrolase YesR
MKKSFLLFVLLLMLDITAAQVKAKEYDLKHWPEGKSPNEIAIRITEKFLKTPHTRSSGNTPGVDYKAPPPYINYPEVCTWLGGLWFANATKNDELFKKLEKRFAPLFEEEKNMLPKPNHVDNNVFGSVPLELYLKTKVEKYLKLGLLYADTQWDLPDDANSTQKKWTDQGYSWQTRLWIDDMFMITAVQSQAYRSTKNRKYIDRTAKEMVLYLDKLQLENGLFYHTPDAHFSWGRGNGWMAVGMAEILRILPKSNPDRARIMTGYHKMMAALLEHQAEDGMWRQIIDDPELWKETSCTGMFTYAMITGVKYGWLDKKTYGTAARKGWLILSTYINENDEITEVCAGTGARNDREHYINRPRIVGDFHGHAPILWCAAGLLR